MLLPAAGETEFIPESSISGYAAMPHVVLRQRVSCCQPTCYAMSGTDMTCAIGLCACYAVPGTDLAYGATREFLGLAAIFIWLRYALLRASARAMRCPKAGTEVPSVAQNFGTDRAPVVQNVECVWPRPEVRTPRAHYPGMTIGLRAPYAMSGTDLTYVTMRCPVLT
eukprot:2304177-Rhodomonas_salina.2